MSGFNLKCANAYTTVVAECILGNSSFNMEIYLNDVKAAFVKLPKTKVELENVIMKC